MTEIISRILNYISSISLGNLNSTEFYILIGIIALLILVLAYRWFGKMIVWVLLLIYMLIYVLYVNDIFSFIEKYQENTDQHIQTIEEELNIE